MTTEETRINENIDSIRHSAINVPLIKLISLSRSFTTGNNQSQILKDVNLTINAGDFVAIVGPSGSGKSTLMHILGGLDIDYDGEYYFSNQEIKSLSPNKIATIRSTKFGFIFQRYMLITQLNALGNVMLPSRYVDSEISHSKTRAERLLTLFGLNKAIYLPPKLLSGGEQQRVAIARAIMNQPQVIFADEPTGALDQTNSNKIIDLLHQLNAAGCTIVLITHENSLAEQAKRIIAIKDGRLTETSHRQNNEKHQATPLSNTLFETKPDTPSNTKQRNKLWRLKALWIELKYAFESVMLHPTRMFLTALGMAIGIASVVAIISITEGSHKQILKNLSDEIHRIAIFPSPSIINRFSQGLSAQQYKALENIANIELMSPVINQNGKLNITQNNQLNISIKGVNEYFIKVFNHHLISGGNFTNVDINKKNHLAIIHQQHINIIFKNELEKNAKNKSVIGRNIFINGIVFKIIGIYDERIKKEFNSQSLPAILLPYTVVSNLFVNLQTFEQFQIRINDINLLSQTEALIRKKLITIDSNFKIYSQTRYLENINNTSKALTHLLIAIATIALFISAVGIMNIVYVSIQERIQEIGIRIAIGANKNNIAIQFLLESVVICILGGFAGIILGYIAAWVLANLNPDWAMSISWRANLLAIVSTLFIGLFFGYFPARKAAKLNPIYALTRE